MRRISPWIACALIALFAVPALATGKSDPSKETDGAFVVFDRGYHEAGEPETDNVVNITPGGKVSFGYLDGSEAHNVVFAQPPTSCVQTSAGSGEQITDAPPLPASAQTKGWTGSCTFNAPGTYEFFCSIHEMRGTVEVSGGTASPSPSPSPSASPSASPSPSPTATATGPARIDAHDLVANNLNWWQDASSASTTDASVTVKAGESVTFAFPSGGSVHNLTFPADPKPASCTQTKGPYPNPSGGPPMPLYPAGPGWEGNCKFNAAGTYSFVCSVHPEMKGTVIVTSNGEPTASPSPTPTATASPSPTASATATASATTSATATATAPPAVVVPIVTSTPQPAVQRVAANPKLSATFTRKTRTLAFTGTIAPKSGTVKIAVSYKVGKKTIKKTVSAKIANGKFSAKLKLTSTKPAKLSTTLTYSGDSSYLPATKKATPKVKK